MGTLVQKCPVCGGVYTVATINQHRRTQHRGHVTQLPDGPVKRDKPAKKVRRVW